MLLSPFRLCLLVLFYRGVTLLRVEDGSYTDVLVAFNRGFIRTRDQVKQIENLIKVASRVLYNATQGLAYFKKVIILANGDWKLDEQRNLSTSSVFAKADIRIGSPDAFTPDVFTLQTGECGEPGKFILLSDSFIRDLSESTTELAARRLVQEWVRYRYGVFEEQESFRWEGNEISPETCVDGIRGWAMTENHKRCVLDCGRVRSNCRFFPDINKNSGLESSLMSYPHLPHVKHFCNISNHNKKALSMHNKMCNSKSIMGVILEHEDFKDKHRPTTKETDFIRMFDLRSRLYIFILMELSEMMEEENGTQEVQHFIERFFVHLAPKSAKTGFMNFTNEPKPPLWWDVSAENNEWQTRIKMNVSTRVKSPSAIPDIDKALQHAYSSILNHVRFPMIFLISTGDGKVDENKQYKSWEEEKIATIHSISIGRNLSWQLDHMIQMNGGDSYFVGDAGSRGRGEPRTFNMDMAFLASLQLVANNDHEQPVVIRYERLTVNKIPSYEFEVDDGIGKDLAVVVSRNASDELYDPANHTFQHQNVSGSIAKSFCVDGAKPGRWTLKLQFVEGVTDVVDVMITAKPRVDVQGSWVWVRAWIANVTEDKKCLGSKGYHRIYAEVKKGFNPVINATVVATVQIMDQPDPIRVTLRDNGGVPDVFKDDGIYSNFFPVTERPAGKPIVIVRVSNNDGKAVMKIASCKKSRITYGMLDDDDYKRTIDKFGDSKRRFSEEDFITHARSCFKGRKGTEHICTVPLPLHFTRAAMANSPILFPMNEFEVLRTPPAAIRDLEVVGVFLRGKDFFALLQWTSPEHPRPNTTVERIEVCGSRNQNSLTSKECGKTENIIAIVHDIEPAGEVQQFELIVPKSMVKGVEVDLYLALRARDENKTVGEMSNIAEASFKITDVYGIGRKEESLSWVPWTVGGVVVIVAAVVGAVGCLLWKKKKG